MIMWRDLSAVLAFAIRYRVSPTGRATIKPRLSVVDGPATGRTSRILTPSPMAKRPSEIDNHFTPSSQDHGSLFTVIFAVIVLALGASVFALMQIAGAQ